MSLLAKGGSIPWAYFVGARVNPGFGKNLGN